MDVFPRARITEKLHQSLERGGIVGVFAPSGYGKSVAVELAFSERVLVSLPDDNPQAGAIATAIVEALAPHALPSLSNFLQAPEREDSWKRLADLTAQHLRPTNRIVALDDLQHVNSPVAMRFLERLIAATRRPDNLRWVLIGRDVPALLPISDWIGRDYMSLPLDADDLAFTLEDARGVASQMNIAIDDEILGELLSDVLGWPLAFRIAVRTRLSGKPTFVRSAIASRDVIFDLLESELWRDLSGFERRILTIATYLTDVDADLLARIGFADAPSALAALQRRTPLFVQTAGDGFSAHDLLRSFVSHRHRDDIEDLTTLLAQALALSGRSMRAADLYIRAARWDDAAAVLTAHGPAIIARGERAQLIDAIGQLPHELRERPSLTALFGWCRLDDGNIEAGLADMRRVLDHDAPNALRDAIAEKLIIFYNATGRPRHARDIATQLLSFPQNGDDNILAHAALARAECRWGMRKEPRRSSRALGNSYRFRD